MSGKEKRVLSLLGGAVFLLLLTGCAAVHPSGESLHAASHDFLLRLRWQDYPGAARHLAEEERGAFLGRFLHLGDLRITDVRLDGVDLSPEGDRAVSHVTVEYYLLPSPVVKTLPLRQEWVRHPSAGWQIVTPVPPFP